jgi:hypothetical protein
VFAETPSPCTSSARDGRRGLLRPQITPKLLITVIFSMQQNVQGIPDSHERTSKTQTPSGQHWSRFPHTRCKAEPERARQCQRRLDGFWTVTRQGRCLPRWCTPIHPHPQINLIVLQMATLCLHPTLIATQADAIVSHQYTRNSRSACARCGPL